jgi:hypothetical protein
MEWGTGVARVKQLTMVYLTRSKRASLLAVFWIDPREFHFSQLLSRRPCDELHESGSRVAQPFGICALILFSQTPPQESAGDAWEWSRNRNILLNHRFGGFFFQRIAFCNSIPDEICSAFSLGDVE